MAKSAGGEARDGDPQYGVGYRVGGLVGGHSGRRPGGREYRAAPMDADVDRRPLRDEGVANRAVIAAKDAHLKTHASSRLSLPLPREDSAQ